MPQTASFWIVATKDLPKLRMIAETGLEYKRNWLGLRRLDPEPLSEKIKQIAVDQVNYRYSGFAFSIIAVFSKERLGVDWDKLEHSELAGKLSKLGDAGVYIFSIADRDLLKLKPTGLFYTMEELDQFAIEFEGNKPSNPEIMKNAINVYNKAFDQLSNERLVLLLIEE